MSDGTKIEWTDATWNPITGCSIVSPGCTNCYAMKLAGTRLAHHPSRAGLTRETKAGPVWNGTVRFNEEWLTQPLAWKRPRMVFVCAHGDLFAEQVPDAWINQVLAIMALCPQHTFQILTKRPDRMRLYMEGALPFVWHEAIKAGDKHGARDGNYWGAAHAQDRRSWPLPNIWLGISAEDQARANDRVPELLATPAAIRFVSAEPLIGPINFMSNLGGTLWMGGQRGCDSAHQHSGRAGEVIHGVLHHRDPRLMHHHHDDRCKRGLDWIIVGGENGPRPMQAEWAQSIRDQCAAARTAFFFKQWGSHIPAGQTMANGKVWSPGCGTRLRATKGITGRLLDGVEHSAMPHRTVSHLGA
ncbi:phage Gp37/Gp68 family protein [Bosea thiooxidans]